MGAGAQFPVFCSVDDFFAPNKPFTELLQIKFNFLCLSRITFAVLTLTLGIGSVIGPTFSPQSHRVLAALCQLTRYGRALPAFRQRRFWVNVATLQL